MHQFIEDKMETVFNDFREDLDRIGNFCQLKTFRFDMNNTPDYNNPIMQRLYLLRFLPAYLVEYYFMYNQMLNSNFINKTLNIISIGCGCGVDAWGGKFALDKYGHDLGMRYTGLDIVDWEYSDNVGLNEYYFLHTDINELTELDEEYYNVIVFPKSIGEISNATFNCLIRVLSNTNFKDDRVVLLSSVRKSRDFVDVNRLATITDTFEQVHGYKCLDDRRQYYFDDNERYLYEIYNNFIYPEDIKIFIKDLHTHCQGFINNGFESHEADCSDMSRWPILKTSQIKYQVLRLER
jgi:hypothetical protein